MTIDCIQNEIVDCAGVIDCENSVNSFRVFLRNPDGSDGNEVLAFGCLPNQYNIYIEWSDCNGDYVAQTPPPIAVPLSVTNGVGAEIFDLRVSGTNVNKYIYTPPDSHNALQVEFEWGTTGPGGVGTEVCTRSFPIIPCNPISNIHRNAGTIKSKSSLTTSNKIFDHTITATTSTYVVSDQYIPANASGGGNAHISIRNKDVVIIERCCIEGSWSVGDPDQLFGINGIDIRDSGRVIVRDCQISGFYDGIYVADCDDYQIERNNVFDMNGHHIFPTRCRNLNSGQSWVRNNFCWWDGPFYSDDRDTIRSVDLINIYAPIWQPHAHVDVSENFCAGWKNDNGVSIIVDGRYTTAYAAAGAKFGKVNIHDNVCLYPANKGCGINFGTDCRIEDNCVFSDVDYPTAGGVTPSSGGLAYGVREVIKIQDVPDPNFGGHYVAGNLGHVKQASGQDSRFFGPDSSTYTLGPGNNFPPNQSNPWNPTTDVDTVTAKGLALVTEVPCYV